MHDRMLHPGDEVARVKNGGFLRQIGGQAACAKAARGAVGGLAAAGGRAILYAAFELGRYDAGFRVVDSVRGALSASARIRELEAENEKQRGELEAAEVARRVDREGYKQVERSLGDMQSQIARLNQDLSFYRGLGAAGLAHSRESAADANRAGRGRGPIPPEIRADADGKAGQHGRGQRRDHASMGCCRANPELDFRASVA